MVGSSDGGPNAANQPQQEMLFHATMESSNCLEDDIDAETLINLALTDPPRWGWTAAGGISDLLPPHERSRRRSTAVLYRKLKRKRASSATAAARTGDRSQLAIGSGSNTQPGNKPKTQSAATPTAPSAQTLVPITEKIVLNPEPSMYSPNISGGGQPPKPSMGESSSEEATQSVSIPPSSRSSLPSTATQQNPCQELQSSTQHRKQLPTQDRLASGVEAKAQPPNPTSKARTPPMPGTSTVSPGKSTTPTAQTNNSKFSDATMKLTGIQKQYLGMSVTRFEPPGKKDASGRTKNRRGIFECEVVTLHKESGVLDMYSYHRGREGFEPRDPETGELKCTMEPTDTNFEIDAPRCMVSVVVEFPLEDVILSKDDRDNPNRDPCAMYRETIQWDLGDPSTPSPLVFATQLATDFGLDYGQMMDVALSIEQQINQHTRQNISYCAPISINDPCGNERTHAGPPIQTHRFGQVLPKVPGGTRLDRKERHAQQLAMSLKQSSKQRESARSRSQVGGGARTSLSGPNGRRRSLERVYIETNHAEEEEIEEIYCNEVLRRSKAESIKQILKNSTNSASTLLERKTDAHCHICHKRCKTTYFFGCGIQSHSYCENHCKNRLENFNASRPMSAHCPICSLTCICSKCNRKRDAVARLLKKNCEKQGTKPELGQLDDILTICREISVAKNSRGGQTIVRKRVEQSNVVEKETSASPTGAQPKNNTKPKRSPNQRPDGNRQRPGSSSRPWVPKPPLSEFPREIYGTVELEPGTLDDYLRMYTAKGVFIADDFPEVWAEQQQNKQAECADSLTTNNGEIVEDGNVDFCHECRNHGNLVCCDFCPRAFHLDCMKCKNQSAADERWECYICKQEKLGLDSDLIDGKKSLDLICASFVDVDVTTETALQSMQILSFIHGMILQLVGYDFGYMFAEPVDVDAIQGYSDIVKQPMDLGTIGSKLINAGYTNIIRDGGSFDDVVIAVLKDLELVWHNCYSFNFEGSAIYRMAAVQQRRAKAIQRKSFDQLLNDKVTSALRNYVTECDTTRGKLNNTSVEERSGVVDAKEKALRAHRPKGKHKVTVKIFKPNVNRPIAILDSVSGRIVKIYSSMKSAGHAAHSMIDLGHQCEWPSNQDLVRQVVLKSAADPSVLLFGYRWLFLEDLRSGKVVFPQPPSDGIELRYNDSTFVFLSIDEAVSFSELPKNLCLEDLRSKLSVLARGCPWTEISGLNWRRLPIPEVSDENLSSSKEKGLSLVFQSPPGSSAGDDKKYLELSSVIKEDLVTNRRLIGFDKLKSAYLDWVRTAEASPTFPISEEKTIDNFQRFYLNGDRNIDGLVWRKQTPVIAKESIEPVDQPLSKSKTMMSAVNGIAPSPLVPSAKKRKHFQQDSPVSSAISATVAAAVQTGKNDTMMNHKENSVTAKKHKRDENVHPADARAMQKPVSNAIARSTPCSNGAVRNGIQLFKPAPEQNGSNAQSRSEQTSGKDSAPASTTTMATS